MSKINILDYISNLIAGQPIIQNLYCNVDNARYGLNNSRKFCYVCYIPGIGRKSFTSLCLYNLDNRAFNCPLNVLVAEIEENMANNNGKITLQDYITLLLYGRKQIQGLYQAYQKALTAKSLSIIFQYVFVNPYNQYSNLNKNSYYFSKGAYNFLAFYYKSQCKKFNPKLVFSEIYS